MGHALHTVEKPTMRRLGSAAHQAAAGVRLPAFAVANPGVVQRHASGCACGGSCPRCQTQSSSTIDLKANATRSSHLEIGPADDPYEREADAVADRVMRTPDAAGATQEAPPGVQRKCDACEEEDEERLVQPKSDSSCTAAQRDVRTAPPSVDAALRSAGRPLDARTLDFFEPRFGVDFQAVRVHADPSAHGSAREINAKAFTVGQDIVFGAGQFSPGTEAGQRLLAHELTHVVQQSGGVARAVQRQPAAPPACPSSISLSSGVHPVHVPSCGATPVRARQQPASAPVIWSLANGSTQPGFPGAPTTVVAGTTISNAAADAGTITVAAGQTPGFVAIDADGDPSCTSAPVFPLNFASTPTGVTATSVLGPLTSSAANYGARFQNELTSASGNSAHLFHARVNEHFSALATPDATTHLVPTPFGDFTLTSNPWEPDSDRPGWDISATGMMGPDNLSTARSFIDVGRFVASASNPTPATTLTAASPVGFTVRQDLHWFCPQAAVGSQWSASPFARLTHNRQLFESSGVVSFVTGILPSFATNSDPYTGQPAIVHASATPNPVLVSPTLPPRSPRGTPRPTPNTTMVTADTLPSSLSGLTGRHALRFSIRGAALGCRINATTGELTAGSTPGTVTVRVSDVDRTNHNFDEVPVSIVATLPAPSTTAPPAPTGTHPGLYPHSVPGDLAVPPPLPVIPNK